MIIYFTSLYSKYYTLEEIAYVLDIIQGWLIENVGSGWKLQSTHQTTTLPYIIIDKEEDATAFRLRFGL